MKLDDAIITLDEVIPSPDNKMVDGEHKHIAIAWKKIRQFIIDSKWRDATVEIPPDQEEVLVLTQCKNGVRNIDKGYWAIDHFIHRGSAQVTHWMPLPKKPEVK